MRKWLCPAILAVLSVPVFAQNLVDDAIRLAQGGVSEDVMVTWVDRSGAHTINAADIVRMKENKVSERVILAMLRNARVTAEAPVRIAAPAVQRNTSPYIQHAVVTNNDDESEVDEPVRTVERIRYVQAPSYVTYAGGYSSPYYYGGYYPSYSYPRYYGSYCGYPRYYGSYCGSPRFSLGYSSYGHCGSRYYGGFRGGFGGSIGFSGGFGSRGGFGFRGGRCR